MSGHWGVVSDQSSAEILADYPDLDPNDIQACIEYAAAQLDHRVLVASA